MAKRVALPGASELFRPTSSPTPNPVPRPDQTQPKEQAPLASGRVKHDHKITVYFSEDELNALEEANMLLRRSHGVRVDRGRLVRIAVALALRDLHAQGAESELVRELRG